MLSDSESERGDQDDQTFNKLAPQQITFSRPKALPSKPAQPAVKAINLNVLRQKRPRLVIDHMVLEDFKSYAGRQIIGSFHGNFTSVVGPNGSGKSNLIESMLFIFGFNASWMRLNKLNQLIHNSSTSSGNSRAAVEVHFKKLQEMADGTLVEVQGYQFWIRRTVNSSSISKYYIQGKESTQAEVKQRLRSQGIDLGNNRFLILQGEVEQISQMKQKSGDAQKPGLLEYLEEIIGSNQFIDRIQQCGRQYAQAQEQKHQKGQLMKLVETELKGMSKAKDEAVKYVRKQKKIFQVQNIFNQVLVALTKQECKKLKQQLIDLEKNRDKIIQQQRERLKIQAQRIRQIKKNKNQIDEIQKQLQKFQQACTKMQAEDKHITQEVTFKSEDLVKFQRKNTDADHQMNKIIHQCQQIRQRLPKSKKILDERGKQLQTIRNELAKYDKPHLKQKIKECEVDISKNQLETNTIKNKLQSVKESYSKLKMGRGELEGKLKQYRQKLSENTGIKEKISKAKGIAEKIVKQKKQKVSGLNQKREELKNELRKYENELKQQMTETQNQGQMGNMFREIMQQGFPGVLGRLGDLGEVSREYDEIITTCCNKLDNIVCNDLDTAKAVLDFLKKRKLGRATCIILDKIGEFRNYMNRPFQVLPRAVRLFDVIKFKTEEAKLAFYFALSDTLYTQDSDLGLDYSMKNEHQRRRVISRNRNRNGFITYEMNGLMVGSVGRRGGFQVKAGIKNKKSKDQGYLRQMEQKKKTLVRQLDELSKKIESEQTQIKTAQTDLEQMRRELMSVDDTIKECQQQIKDISEMVAKAEGRSNSYKQLQKQIQALQQAQGELNNNKKKLESVLKDLEAQQRRNETPEINALRQKFKTERAEANRLQKQSQKQRVQMQTGIKRIDDLKKSKVDCSKTLQRLKKQIDKLKNEQLQLQNKVADIIGKMTALEQRIKDCKKVESELKMVMEEDDKEVKESRAKVQKARKDVENCIQNGKHQNHELKLAESELQRMRENYKQLSSTYTFFQELDEIQKMNIGGDKNFVDDPPSPRNSSSLMESSMLNTSLSLDTSHIKNFPIDRLLKTEPLQNLDEDLLQVFMFFKDKLSGMISGQTAALKKIEGNNLQIINEFKQKYGHYRERLLQFEAVKQRQLQLKRIIDTLKDQRLVLFRQGFGIINAKLKQVYQHLTRGGDAQMELIDSLDPFSDGVNFSVRPPKKSWKEVNKLSGGEKTLSSLSLIFALHYYKPTPLYFMDEIDAALDFKNVSIVADYIKKRTKDAQFIIISLRNNMFDLADKLIGVYKTYDKTKVINLQPAKLLKLKEDKQKQNIQSRANLRSSLI